MDLKALTPVAAAEAIEAATDIEVVREAAKSIDIKFSGNSGIDTIKSKILEDLATKAAAGAETAGTVAPVETPAVLDDDGDLGDIQVAKAIPAGPSIEELLEMDPKTIEDTATRRKAIRAQALNLVRVKITNLDPNEVQLDAVLVTALNKYTGKVSRTVPFDLPWHVETILLKQLKNQKFVLRKEKKNGKFGVKEYHDPTYVNKYSIEILPMLTEAERLELAAAQRASGAIDKPA